jgi:hypothetical protein
MVRDFYNYFGEDFKYETYQEANSKLFELKSKINWIS